MEVRKDFHEISDLLGRLIVFSQEFKDLDKDEWSHLKNREDYEKIYSYEKAFPVIEKIYQKGRQFEREMESLLVQWNSVSDFPYFAKYVDELNRYLKRYWLRGPDSLEKVLRKVKKAVKDDKINLYSINEMIKIYEKQIIMADCIVEWIKHAKKSVYYKAGSGLPKQRPWWKSIPAIILFVIAFLTFVFTFLIKIKFFLDFTDNK